MERIKIQNLLKQLIRGFMLFVSSLVVHPSLLPRLIYLTV